MATHLDEVKSVAGRTGQIDRPALERALAADGRAVAVFRDALRNASDNLSERFRRNEPIEGLVRERAVIVDSIILASWPAFRCASFASRRTWSLSAATAAASCIRNPTSTCCVLLDERDEQRSDEAIGRFLTFLWDIGLEVGHSVRTLDDCEAQARSDVTVADDADGDAAAERARPAVRRAAEEDRQDAHVEQRASSFARSSMSRPRGITVITILRTTSSPT